LHDIGLISIEEYYGNWSSREKPIFQLNSFSFCSILVQVKKLLKRQRQSANLTVEQIQKKLAENGFLKDDSTKNAPVNNLFLYH